MNSLVYFIGAGPGDVELITLKAVRALEKSNVVLYDRLVNPEILDLYTSPFCKKIFVGKEGYNQNSLKQSEVNEILLDYALKEPIVSRLKGGDVSIFANIMDELYTLKKNSIHYEIIPGITAASGIAAYTGISLTARKIARGVRYLTILENEFIDDKTWLEYSLTTDTLVFYMSLKSAEKIFYNLKRFGCEKPFAIIQNGTTHQQTTIISNIEEYKSVVLPSNQDGPTLLVIGEVVKMHQEYQWFKSEVNPCQNFSLELI